MEPSSARRAGGPPAGAGGGASAPAAARGRRGGRSAGNLEPCDGLLQSIMEEIWGRSGKTFAARRPGAAAGFAALRPGGAPAAPALRQAAAFALPRVARLVDAEALRRAALSGALGDEMREEVARINAPGLLEDKFLLARLPAGLVATLLADVAAGLLCVG